jgi:hypothetical protein
MSESEQAYQSSLARAEAAWKAAPKDQEEVSQAEIEYDKARQLEATTASDVLDELADCEAQLEQALHIGNPELIGRLVLKVKELYAENCVNNRYFGNVYRKDIPSECAKMIAQWCLERQGVRK